jgi:hypothetical protein
MICAGLFLLADDGIRSGDVLRTDKDVGWSLLSCGMGRGRKEVTFGSMQIYSIGTIYPCRSPRYPSWSLTDSKVFFFTITPIQHDSCKKQDDWFRARTAVDSGNAFKPNHIHHVAVTTVSSNPLDTSPVNDWLPRPSIELPEPSSPRQGGPRPPQGPRRGPWRRGVDGIAVGMVCAALVIFQCNPRKAG